jgi:putative glycosyltransferase (TIGR04372 family)
MKRRHLLRKLAGPLATRLSRVLRGDNLPILREHLSRAVVALDDTDIAGCVRYVKPVASLSCSDEEIDKLFVKEEACHYLGVAYLQGLGQLDNAVFWWRERSRTAERIARHFVGDPALNAHKPIFDSFWTRHLGHTAVLGIHVKRHLLEGPPYVPLTLVGTPDSNPGNPCLVNHLQKYFDFVESTAHLPFPDRYVRYLSRNMYLEPSLLGPHTYYWQVYAEISRAWEQAGGEALLELSEKEVQRGKQALAGMGLPRGAWYVCLHVRSVGYKATHEALQAALNADIRTYDLAMDAIVERGGWVVRMGDRSMPKLPRRRGVVDYAHSAQKTDWMDVFLWGTCRFYVGTSSGPAYVPNLFGVPSVFTNWFPTGTRPLNSADLYIPKLHWYQSDGDFAPFLESLAPPLGYIHINQTLKRLGVTIQENTREELRDVVVEMLDRLEAKTLYTAEDGELQTAFNLAATHARSYGNARIGRDFVRKYRRLLPSASLPAHRADGRAGELLQG